MKLKGSDFKLLLKNLKSIWWRVFSWFCGCPICSEFLEVFFMYACFKYFDQWMLINILWNFWRSYLSLIYFWSTDYVLQYSVENLLLLDSSIFLLHYLIHWCYPRKANNVNEHHCVTWPIQTNSVNHYIVTNSAVFSLRYHYHCVCWTKHHLNDSCRIINHANGVIKLTFHLSS
jgi:hypothetical protein